MTSWLLALCRAQDLAVAEIGFVLYGLLTASLDQRVQNGWKTTFDICHSDLIDSRIHLGANAFPER